MLTTKQLKMAYEAKYVVVLRQRLREHVEENWRERFGHLAPSFTQLKKRNAFLEELKTWVEQEVIARKGTAALERLLISKDTLRRMLHTEYERGFYDGSKQAIAIFLGYNSWEHFLREQTQNNAEGAEQA